MILFWSPLIYYIINEGGPKSQAFWKARQRILKSNHIPEYETINEEGEQITDPESSKEHIAKYFENLYQAREATPEYIESANKIQEKVNEWATQKDHNPDSDLPRPAAHCHRWPTSGPLVSLAAVGMSPSAHQC